MDDISVSLCNCLLNKEKNQQKVLKEGKEKRKKNRRKERKKPSNIAGIKAAGYLNDKCLCSKGWNDCWVN